MFTRAGFNARHVDTGILARVSIRDGRRNGWAKVIRFRSGDLAWYSNSASFLCWGIRAQIHDLMRMPERFLLVLDEAPYSDIATRREYNMPDPPKPKPPLPVWEQPKLFA